MNVPLPKVWRLNIKTAAEEGTDPRQFCLDSGCLGVGWPVESNEPIDWESYIRLGERQYKEDNGWWAAVNALHTRMQDNDLCWTRDLDGIYYLGRVRGTWQYLATDENLRADVVNVRACDWLRAGPVDVVPGKIVNSFRPSRTLQAVDDETIQIYSAHLYNTSGPSGAVYGLPTKEADIFSLLSSEDCEDLVALYMQLQGYVLLPSSCKLATVAYEWIMLDRKSGDRAAAQVKSGYDDLVPAEYADFPGKVFLFTSRGSYIGDVPPNVTCISVADIAQLMKGQSSLLPRRIQEWASISRELCVGPISVKREGTISR